MNKTNIISASAALVSGIAVVALIFYVINPDRVAASPVVMELEINSLTKDICPGDVITWNTTMIIRKPATIQGFITVINAETRATLQSDTLGLPAFNHPEPVAITRTANWSAPDLGPGNYERILSITALGYDGAPAFSIIPFSIRENCE